jgi:hypothetical protein
MAQTLKVKPEYVNKVQVHVNGKLTLLNNNLTQEQLLAFFLKAEFREYIDITYTNIADSFPESFEIDPNLFHAYESGEVTHDPAKTNYPANTVGNHLNETRGKIDAFDGAFVRPSISPTLILNFAGSKFWNPKFPFSRNSLGTYIDQNGVMKTALANKPRFTHDPITKESLGLLMEETRTNLVLNSEVFTGSGYGKTNLSIVQSAQKFLNQNWTNEVIEDSTNAAHNFSTLVTGIAPAQTHSVSMFVKKGVGNRHVRIELNSIDSTNAIKVYYDLGLGQLSSTSVVGAGQLIGTPKCEAYIDGWFRVSFQAILDTTSTSSRVQVVLQATPTGVAAYQGDGVSSILMSGLQVELGLNTTSYIKTDSIAVTRYTDLINITGSLFLELFPYTTEGTIFLAAKKADARPTGNFKQYLRFLGVTGNYISISDYDNQAKVYAEIYTGGVSVYNKTQFSVDFNSFFLTSFAYRLNNGKSYCNGIEGNTDTDLTIPQVTSFQLGGDMNTIIKSVVFWPTVLTNASLLSLTSLNSIGGKNPSQLPSNSDLSRNAFISPEAILRSKSRQEFSIDATGTNTTRNVRRDYDFTFEIVDSSGCTITATPPQSCTAGTDNPLTFSGPVGKTLTYAITPIYEY